MADRSSPRSTSSSRALVALAGGWVVSLLLTAAPAWSVYLQTDFSFLSPCELLLGERLGDSTRYFLYRESCWMFPILAAVPIFWMWRNRPRPAVDRGGSSRGLMFAWLASAVVAATAIASYARVGFATVENGTLTFGELPPAYHDEFSYLFQAQTFQAGRWSYPSHPQVPRLFDQMHVVNEGRFASRYFPATGAWMAVVSSPEHPYCGHWLAGILTAVFLFWAGRELGGNAVGFLAGMLTALSPGMAVFGNLLLAHHPAVMGLSAFLFLFLRMMRTGCWFNALLAGIALSFAMLARPMTAAGFALPFGLWFAWRWLKKGGWSIAEGPGSSVQGPATVEVPNADSVAGPSTLNPRPSSDPRSSIKLAAAALLVALFAGFAVLGVQNRAITGDVMQTPYDLFTRTYTPRHGYGFDNVGRADRRIRNGQQRPANRAFGFYDHWAENLTPALAANNVAQRWLASWQWTLGVVPLTIATVVFLVCPPMHERRWWLVAASIVSLHLVHVPYWFDGIMHWHYVFESGPLWLLLFAAATKTLWTSWLQSGRRAMCVWWTILVGTSLAMCNVSHPDLWTGRTQAAIGELTFSRLRHRAFRRLVEKIVTKRPALVLVEIDPAERHIDFVINPPDLNAEILIGRYRPVIVPLDAVRKAFPARTLYHYDARTRVIRPLNDDASQE